MSHLEQYLVPWIISNIVALLILWNAFKSHLADRVFVLLLGWACWMNFTTARSQPEIYLEYASLAASWYSNFILGWFSQHITTVVCTIGIGQGLITVVKLLMGWWVMLAIAPFRIGVAFPFSSTYNTCLPLPSNMCQIFIRQCTSPSHCFYYFYHSKNIKHF